MNRQFIGLGLVGLGLVGLVGAGVSAQFAMANPVKPANQANQANPANQPNQGANEPLCFIQHPSSQSQDLTQICGQSSLSPTRSVTQIDPNTPVNFNMPRSRTPSALWNTEPDSDEPIEIGETYVPMPAAARPTTAPASPAQAPTGDAGMSLDDE